VLPHQRVRARELIRQLDAQAREHRSDRRRVFPAERQQDRPLVREVRGRIDRVQSELPELLMAMGKKEQQEAAKAEPKSPEGAVAHLERAETALDKAGQLAPKNQEAQAMQQQVQSDLARLRQQLAQQAEKQQQQQSQQQQNKPADSKEFAEMLSQVKATQEQREVNARHQPPRKYDPAKPESFRNW